MDPRSREEMVREHYRNLTLTLIERNLSITTMESATGGQIASLITDTEGSSAILKGAFVTYSNEAKILQGVPREIIERYSVYSEETAAAMARACRQAYQADLGIGVTGTMGNTDPFNPRDSHPGEVYFAIDYEGKCSAFHDFIPRQPSRLAYKLAVADAVYESIMKAISSTAQ